MNLLCAIFGHKPPVYAEKGWWSPGEEYGRVQMETTDGIGRNHAKIYAECPRCAAEFCVARIHVPANA